MTGTVLPTSTSKLRPIFHWEPYLHALSICPEITHKTDFAHQVQARELAKFLFLIDQSFFSQVFLVLCAAADAEDLFQEMQKIDMTNAEATFTISDKLRQTLFPKMKALTLMYIEKYRIIDNVLRDLSTKQTDGSEKGKSRVSRLVEMLNDMIFFLARFIWDSLVHCF